MSKRTLSLRDLDYKRSVWESLEIAITHAKVADSPFDFLVNQIQAMHNTEFSIKKRDDDVALYTVDAEHMAASLFQHIAHGDDNHRDWLKEHALAWATSYLEHNVKLRGDVKRPA